MKWFMSGGLAFILSCSQSTDQLDELWKRCNNQVAEGKNYDGVDPANCRKALNSLDEYIRLAPDDPDGYRAKCMVNEFLLQSTENKAVRDAIKHDMYACLDTMFQLVNKGKTFKRLTGSPDYLKTTYEELKKELGK